MQNHLNVYLKNKFMGVLEKDGNGGIIFKYSNSANHILSISLPLNQNQFENRECRGFFNGLLPESENTRIAIGKKYGINPKNDFSILEAIGYDCAGAVSFFSEETDNIQNRYKLEYTELSKEELAKYIKELPQKPLGIAIKDMRLSLAGAQDKTAVVIKDGKIGLPKSNVPTTHILKPVIKGYKETVENEYICMKTAEKLGIKTANAEIGEIEGIKYLLIERYDRIVKNGEIERIHQEDFCQASNIISAYKYQAEGGVDFKRCFEILRRLSKPAVSIKQFIELMIFNYLIGNNDAHGKNFSILHYDDGVMALAPAYDLLCSTVYNDLSEKMAMKIGGHYEHNKILLRHFEKLAQDVNISFTQLKKIIKYQCEILPSILEEVVNSFDNTIGEEILKVTKKNCERLK